MGRDPLRQSVLVLFLVAIVEHAAIREPPARQAFAQLFGHVGASLEERGQRILGYLIDRDSGERGELAIQRLTGEQSQLAEIISPRQAPDFELAAIFLR